MWSKKELIDKQAEFWVGMEALDASLSGSRAPGLAAVALPRHLARAHRVCLTDQLHLVLGPAAWPTARADL